MEKTREPARRVIELFKENGDTLSFAESCTGGMIAAAVTDIAGASEVFWGSAVTYANSAKKNVLGVSHETLTEHGAVSSECAAEMARGSRRIYGTDVALSVTGIAGPDGGSAEKPVGTVWFGISTKNGEATFKKVFSSSRSVVRQQTVMTALYALEELALKKQGEV